MISGSIVFVNFLHLDSTQRRVISEFCNRIKCEQLKKLLSFLSQ